LIWKLKLYFHPLSYFPQGGNDLLLPPWGKVGKGVTGFILKQKTYVVIGT